MGDGNIPSVHIQNAVFNSTCKLVSRSTINLITSYHRREVINDSYFKDLLSDQSLSDLSSVQLGLSYITAYPINMISSYFGMIQHSVQIQFLKPTPIINKNQSNNQFLIFLIEKWIA